MGKYGTQTHVTIMKGDRSVIHLFGVEAELYKDIEKTRRELTRGKGMKVRAERYASRSRYKWNLSQSIRNAIA